MEQLRIGVCGRVKEDNDLSRKIEALNCKPVFIDVDRGSLPNFLDAIIYSLIYTSHGRMYEVKDFAKKHGIPIFYTRDGWSHIAAQVTDFVQRKGKGLNPQFTPKLGHMGNAMREALAAPPELPKSYDKQPPIDVPVTTKNNAVLSKPRGLYDVIKAYYAEGKKPVEIAVLLKRDGWKNMKGHYYEPPGIAAIKSGLKNGTLSGPGPIKYDAPVAAVAPKTEVKKEEAKQVLASDAATLQKLIMEAQLTDAVKLSRLKGVLEGKIKSTLVHESEIVGDELVISQYEITKPDVTQITLTKDDARLIVQSHSHIAKFLEGKNGTEKEESK